jgi:uncharacterized protein YcbK (DUF882 family)
MLAAGAAAALPRVALASFAQSPREIAFHNLHTNETTKLVYWSRGAYVPESLERINHILRDHRVNEATTMDPALMDRLHELHARIGSRSAFQVISGYRSPQTNAALHSRSGGVASHSLHMEGKAIDIRLSDIPLEHLQKAALAMNDGGVGYYPKSDFVHLDTGRVRKWGGA